MRRWGLGDALGLVVALTALTYAPMWVDPASFPKLLVLTVGCLAIAPFVVIRWLRADRPSSWALMPCLAAAALLASVSLATLAADAPWPTRLFGWWLRADGLLAVVAAAVLLLGAATLSRTEVQRAIGWLVAGAGLAAVLAIPQVAGIDFMTAPDGTVLSTLGNANFAGAFFAMAAVLALGNAFLVTTQAWRIANLVAAACYAALAFLSASLQGPMALGAGLLMFGYAFLLGYRGPRRLLLIGTSTIVIVAGLAVSVLGMLSTGPLGFIGREGNTQWRYMVWSAGLETIQAHPVIGIGTGSFSRYISAYRPVETVAFTGESMRPSAVHSIPLQFGIVGGWPALLLWLVVFAGALVLLLMALRRGPQSLRWIGATAVGGLSAYLAQAIVSIDTPSIIAIGWLLAGLAIAVTRICAEPAQRRSTSASEEDLPARLLIRATVASVVLAFIGGWAVMSQIQAVERVRSIPDGPTFFAAIADPMVPCPVRLEIANGSLKGMQLRHVLPAVVKAVSVDPRCPPIVNLQSQIALQARDLTLADSSTALGVELDPQSKSAWQFRRDFFTLIGDPGGLADTQRRLDALADATTPSS